MPALPAPQKSFFFSSGRPTTDGLLHRDGIFLAHPDVGLVLVRDHTVLKRWNVSVERLVPSDDGRTILAVSKAFRTDHSNGRFTREVHLLTEPWAPARPLGTHPIHGLCDSFDGTSWGTFEGDDLLLYALDRQQGSLTLQAQQRLVWPCALARCTEGLWVENAALGSSDGEYYSLPTLAFLRRESLTIAGLRFPPEQCHFVSFPPQSCRGIAAIHGAARQVADSTGQHRLATTEGSLIALLPEAPAGLAARGVRALAWYKSSRGTTLLYVSLPESQVLATWQLPGVQQVSVRLHDKAFTLWDEHGLVYTWQESAAV